MKKFDVSSEIFTLLMLDINYNKILELRAKNNIPDIRQPKPPLLTYVMLKNSPFSFNIYDKINEIKYKNKFIFD